MGKVKISDACIWIPHVSDDQLEARLDNLKAHAVVCLLIDGHTTIWSKMAQGKNPSQTRGLKPATPTTNRIWQNLYKTRKGESVSVCEVKL